VEHWCGLGEALAHKEEHTVKGKKHLWGDGSGRVVGYGAVVVVVEGVVEVAVV